LHPYSTNSEERARVYLFLAAAAFGLAWLTAALIGAIRIPFWLDVPATGAFYGVLYQGFEKWGWKQGLFRRLGIVSVPDLSGTWCGTVSSSFDKNAEIHDVTVQIVQNWTHLSVGLSSEYSESCSIVGSVDTGPEVVLSYQYQNTPKAHAGRTMHAHRGTAVLTLSADRRNLTGEYYSGRDRRNYGALNLTKGND
jgi:hypothetical protein